MGKLDEEYKLNEEFNLEELRHRNKMEELEYARKTITLDHNNQLERGRIFNAEERKKIERKLFNEKELIDYRNQKWNK